MPGTLKRSYSAPAATARRVAAASKIQKASRMKAIASKRQAHIAAVTAAKKASFRKAAEQAVMGLREEKYFDVNADLQSFPQVPAEGPKRVSTIAFATTSNLDDDGVTMQYCGHDINNLQMANPFKSNAADDVAPYAIDGKRVIPTQNHVGWQINRIFARLQRSGTTNSSYYVEPSLVNQCPVRCRIIRVTPKLLRNARPLDPTNDLFIDQRGLKYGPQNSAFSYSDAEFAEVNRRVWTVLGDQKFSILPPTTQNFSDNGGTSWSIGPPFTAPGQCTKKLLTTHQIAAKKGGSVFYNKPDDANTLRPDADSRREFIFMHFWYDAADGSGAGGNTPYPDLAPSGTVPDRDVVKVHWRVESRFKEM